MRYDSERVNCWVDAFLSFTLKWCFHCLVLDIPFSLLRGVYEITVLDVR